MLHPRGKRRLCWRIVCFGGSMCLTLYVFLISYDIDTRTNFDDFPKSQDYRTEKYIFDLAHWYKLMLIDSIFSTGNQSLWCDIPAELRLISDAICQEYNRNDCTRLPCQMVYSSPTTLEDVKCINGGQVWKKTDDDNDSAQQQPTLLCKRGFSLDLFSKKVHNSSYPSINTLAFTPFSDKLYIDVLNNRFRTYDSMWGFTFNFESISNYPWSANRKKLKLFDVTFGYDRQLYDFIPAPWLFNYVERLKSNTNRLSMQKAMDDKKPIHPITTSKIYWVNLQRLSATQKEEDQTSYVTAPVLWMNTNCVTKSKRTQYMLELMKYIDVDNYGNCGKNIRSLPKHIVQIQGSLDRDLKNRRSYNWEAGKLALSSDHLFTIAIENSINNDYITEKLWHPLVAGSVPIYLGAPNVLNWLPCKTNCIIDLTQFRTPKDAAAYIKTVAMNRTLYESYHQWRNEPISQNFQKILSYFETIGNYSLDCILCDMSHRVRRGENPKEIKRKLRETIGSF